MAGTVSRSDEVGLNEIVEVYFEEDDETEQYKIVTSIRSNSLKGKISIESPLGKALLGKKEGDTVTVKVNDDYSYDVVIRKIDESTDDAEDEIKSF
jgi:transcription elongation factor GreA